ncbi:MAG: adenylyltransferase/cytidyltransferase family protein [Desulfosudis oleivorans]|nr:adenylyltransferase/cytidyltransferase family protein [Desulfosudis oleivorans]
MAALTLARATPGRHRIRSKIYARRSTNWQETVRGSTNELERRGARARRVAFTNGCFDILHAGHVRYLREAAKLGDALDPGPQQRQPPVRGRSRGRSGRSCPRPSGPRWWPRSMSVDYVTLFDELTPLRAHRVPPAGCPRQGGDWAEKRHRGRRTPSGNGAGRVAIMPEIEGASTTNIVDKVLQVYGRV